MVVGKVALVTGAASGIGREVCRILARQGAKVVAADRNLKAAQETVQSLNDSEHLPVNIEVSDSESVKEAFRNVRTKYSSPPTIIVNSAGITRDQFLLKLGEHDFDQVLDANLKGTFLVMRTAVQEMIAADVSNGGSIVNISSIIAKTGNMGQANYAASKAGVIALAKTASIEFAQFGVRVNTVLPGFIETPMTEVVPDNVKHIFMKRISLRRMGKPEEVAEVVAFLGSSKSSYVNGASIDVTGGMF